MRTDIDALKTSSFDLIKQVLALCNQKQTDDIMEQPKNVLKSVNLEIKLTETITEKAREKIRKLLLEKERKSRRTKIIRYSNAFQSGQTKLPPGIEVVDKGLPNYQLGQEFKAFLTITKFLLLA